MTFIITESILREMEELRKKATPSLVDGNMSVTMLENIFKAGFESIPASSVPKFTEDACLIVCTIDIFPDVVATLRNAWADIKRLQSDLTKITNYTTSCARCNAPLFEDDDYVIDPDGNRYGCFSAMTDLLSKHERPCYAYRVGKDSANPLVKDDKA